MKRVQVKRWHPCCQCQDGYPVHWNFGSGDRSSPGLLFSSPSLCSSSGNGGLALDGPNFGGRGGAQVPESGKEVQYGQQGLDEADLFVGEKGKEDDGPGDGRTKVLHDEFEPGVGRLNHSGTHEDPRQLDPAEQGQSLGEVVVPRHGAVEERDAVEDILGEEVEWGEGDLTVEVGVEGEACGESSASDIVDSKVNGSATVRFMELAVLALSQRTTQRRRG